MGKIFEAIDDPMREWIQRQTVFFVATSPLGATGHINCSPKGGDTLRVIGPHELAYVDGAGSGIETVAHLRENARILIMLCAFDGPPKIMRFHGVGTVLTPKHKDFQTRLAHFPTFPVVRSIIHVAVTRISDSCGYGVPLMDFREAREDSAQYLANISDSGLKSYLARNNQLSVDGLAGMTTDELDATVIRRGS